MPRSRKIVFFFPSFASSDATAPLGILAVATPLIRAGYQIVLIDSTITPDYKKRVLELQLRKLSIFSELTDVESRYFASSAAIARRPFDAASRSSSSAGS